LRDKFPGDTVHLLIPKRNSGNFTYDGIEVGGERVTNEIEEELRRLEEKDIRVRKLSVVGYSLGGLVARYAIGLLFHKGWFDKLEPVVGSKPYYIYTYLSMLRLISDRISRPLPLRT
jgi:hypothetical protein